MGVSASSSSSTPAESTQGQTTTSGISVTNASPPLVHRSGMRQSCISAHGLCGTSPNGVPAYSNYQMPSKTITANYVDGVFMGYKWQCVEYARRWLWLTKGLLLPTRIIAARYKGLKHVYRPVMKDQAEAAASTPVPSRITDVSDGRQAMNAEKLKEQKAWASKAIGWQKVPCTFVYQGTTTSPTVDSLIIYPFTLRNMTGHIGVITMVDLERGLVGVADQNRYFTPWVMSTAEWVALNGNVKVDVHPEDSATETSRQLSLQPKDQEKEQEEEEQQEGADIDIRQPEETALDGMKAVKNALDGQGQDVCFSALFRLECVEGRYFIRDPEDECVGWITFPGYENLPQKN